MAGGGHGGASGALVENRARAKEETRYDVRWGGNSVAWRVTFREGRYTSERQGAGGQEFRLRFGVHPQSQGELPGILGTS